MQNPTVLLSSLSEERETEVAVVNTVQGLNARISVQGDFSPRGKGDTFSAWRILTVQ
jgi:pyridoxal/pyridoxine/pyridoxamine kinase